MEDTNKFTVTYWGSHPELDNDDCWTGHDFDTKEGADADYIKDPYCEGKPGYFLHDTEYVMLEGPGVYMIRKNLFFKKAKNSGSFEREWKREIANEAGMLHGIEAYNDEMGY